MQREAKRNISGDEGCLLCDLLNVSISLSLQLRIGRCFSWVRYGGRGAADKKGACAKAGLAGRCAGSVVAWVRCAEAKASRKHKVKNHTGQRARTGRRKTEIGACRVDTCGEVDAVRALRLSWARGLCSLMMGTDRCGGSCTQTVARWMLVR